MTAQGHANGSRRPSSAATPGREKDLLNLQCTRVDGAIDSFCMLTLSARCQADRIGRPRRELLRFKKRVAGYCLLIHVFLSLWGHVV